MKLQKELLNSLARLVASENAASDLLTLLIELDDKPLANFLQLPKETTYRTEREVSAKGVGGRADIVIYGGTSDPVAVIEMKGATDVHSNQLDRYSSWSKQFKSNPILYLCAFDNDEKDSDPEWQRIRLQDIFSPWEKSDHEHAAWLAHEITKLLETWDAEADGIIGDKTGPYVPAILARRLARDVTKRLQQEVSETGRAQVFPSSGGTRIVLSRVNHPNFPEDDSITLGVDLRLEPNFWRFRPHVQVSMTEHRSESQAREIAFELASELREFMGLDYLREALTMGNESNIAKFLTTSSRHYNGFKKDPTNFNFDGWTKRIAGSADYQGSGAFFADLKGRRLATILYLDESMLTRYDLSEMIVSTLSALSNGASSQAQQ